MENMDQYTTNDNTQNTAVPPVQQGDSTTQQLSYDPVMQPPQPNMYPAYSNIPTPTPKRINKLVFILVSAALFLAIVALVVLLFLQINQTKSYISQTKNYQTKYNQTIKVNSDLNSMLTAQDTKINDIQGQNSQLSNNLNSANSQNQQTKSELNSANSLNEQQKKQIDTATNQLNAINSQLAAKQAELAKNERGIAKFAELKKWFIAYDEDAGAFIQYLASGYNDRNQLQAIYDKAVTDYNNITTIFSQIESGNY
jgi:Membrane-bound metallopeptidase